ncbi:metaxin-1 isoform X1 [Canis lupus baileyi]|uniref:metaxin-1 isoform X1 n=1 Tax=Canis lupus familiaris TaxID=9615 RepID=UPI000DC6A6EC|nr:metaxin-1 isoform X1 [Canis lupus familiaris]XP_025286761.3 metaxin-1 isoform X3 [Canis lupus dingo]XP_038399059.1 metaxin-1 isoform X1 [Canis lupus familiaris]XP_038527891.1 metaxin-1 isoform X1 [Canis lupus familiaris]
MRLGGPPRGPCSGPSPAGPWRGPGRVQICESPQSRPGRTRPASPGPAAPSGLPASPQSRRSASARRARPTTLPPFGSRLWCRRRPPSPEALGSAPCSPAPRSPAPPRGSLLPPPPATLWARRGGGAARGRAEAPGEVLPGQRAGKMAAPMELYCWSGGWGLPSVDLDSLAVLTYARFTGAPLKVHKITNPWQSPSGTLPALRTSHGEVISVPHKIITHLRKETSPPQKYNADYDLSARQGADTLAFMSLLEEKLLPVLIHTFWVDTKNYVEVTRKWYAEAIPFPLNFFLPGRMQRQFMERLQLLCGEHSPENEEELEKELYQEARECLTLLSQRLGSQKFFFGDAPASLDAFVFGYLALLLQAKLPSGKLQAHLRGLQNLCAYCTHILSLYFPWDGADVPLARQTPVGPETEEEPYRRRNQILSVLAGLAAMVGYALLSGIVSIQRATPARAPSTQSLSIAEEDEDE